MSQNQLLSSYAIEVLKLFPVKRGPARIPPAGLANAHTIFIVTPPIYDDQLEERVFRQTGAMADASIEAGAQYLIFSAMVHAKRLHAQSLLAFDLKAEGENYICSLPVKSVLFAPWTFMQTFLGCQAMCPIVEQPSEKAFTNYIPVMRRFRPLKHELILGTSSGQHWLSLNNMLAKLSVKRRACAHTTRLRIPSHRVTGRRAKYIQLSEELWADFVDPKTSDPRAAILKFSENWGTMGKIQGRR